MPHFKSVTFVENISEFYIKGDNLGSGASGEVYKAISTKDNFECAVKVVPKMNEKFD